MTKVEVKSFECDKNLEQYTDSMLFDSGTSVAIMECEVGERKITIDLRVCGEVSVEYNGERYFSPSEFPQELKDLIKNNSYWDCEDNLYVDMNNWFEYIYYNTMDGKTYSDGVMCEIDLSKCSVEDVQKEMIEVAEWIIKD